jgi:hypothetical protein
MKCYQIFGCGVLAVSILTAAAQGELSASGQKALAEKMAAKAQQSEIWTDEDGNVTGLIFINHQALDKKAPGRPGINDSDLMMLDRFPKLTAVNFEAQAIGDEGLSILAKLPQLKQIGLHYMGKNPKATATPACAAFLDGKPDLEILEIKHNFRMDAFDIGKITTPMPKVWRLVLDTPLTPEQTLHLIRLCPNVRDLQLHRTACTADQLKEFGRLLPKLEVLWWKPGGGLSPDHLTALRGFEKLRIFSPQHFRNQLPYEDGWDALLEVKALERLEVEIRDDENGRALKQLLAARPGLEIDAKLTRSRNYNGL